MHHMRPASVADLGAFNPSGDPLRLLPPELWLQILLLVGLPKRHQLRLVSRGLASVVDEHLPVEHLLISVGDPPSWLDDGESAAPGRPTAGERARPAWMRRRHLQHLRLRELGDLTEELFALLGRVFTLRSLWIYRPTPMHMHFEYGLNLGHLRPLGALEELRLDVPCWNPAHARLPTVRRLQLHRYDGHFKPLNLSQTFPRLERLGCRVGKLNTPVVRTSDAQDSVVEELRLYVTDQMSARMEVANVRRWMPRLRRLRLEAANAAELPLLAGFAGLEQLEYSSVCLFNPNADKVPDLTEVVEHLQQSLRLNETVVTLWGFQLGQGEEQADQLHRYLRDRLRQIGDNGMEFTSTFDEIPLEESPAADRPGEGTGAASVGLE